MNCHTLKTPGGPLEFTITHRPRVTKRLHLELDEGGGLVIVAPRHWSKAHIIATLAQNTKRIARFMSRASQQQLSPLLYVCDEMHFFLGDRYQLVHDQFDHGQSGRKRARVSISGNTLKVSTRQLTMDSAKTALQRWYRDQAARVFNKRLQAIAQNAHWLKDRSIPLQLRRMKRTWGNCSSAGLIKLNIHLVKAPLRLIDSVIAHELCHLEQMNHGKSFYALLEGLNPDWRRDRTLLRATGFNYLRV